ncbi:MAG: UDP-glucose/GDP-mannose dehydrogenase family protein [Chloroflexi bacterium]|nr:UDP-glucose/GDP-mannose dehydrogenase family protein [Chloroflexota bacterium]
MKLTVIGLGCVGAVAAAGLAAEGHDVLGVDLDRQRIARLSSGEAPFYEPGLDARVIAGLLKGQLRFLHLDEVSELLGEMVLIATGTPPSAGGDADLSQVWSALEWVGLHGAPGLLVVMKSTVPPGMGLKIQGGLLGTLGMRYVSNPEFLREGRAIADWESPGRIVVGVEEGDIQSIELVRHLYAGIAAPWLVTDITSAEMIKYASNAYLAMRISFINEMASLCDRVGASIDAVSEGLALDERTGDRIWAGVGYGGSCFPKDVKALDHLALTSGVRVDLLRAVINVNNRQRLLPLHALRERFDGVIAGRRVGVLGLAFKPGTDDLRDAPSLDLVQALVDEGAEVQAFDPQAMEPARSAMPASVRLVNSANEAADQAQALVLLTEWAEIVKADWSVLAGHMLPPRFLFDGRNALDPLEMGNLGFEYVGVGRNSGSRVATTRRAQPGDAE